MAWNDNLTPGTAAFGIASSQSERMCVLAGPGTGKSFAMMRRVARLLEEEGVQPEQILAVTFTRVAAEDLHRELINLGVPRANELQGRTLHSLAMAILMRNHVLPVLGRTPRPLNDFELRPLIADIGNAYGDVHQRKRLIKAYGSAWARLQTDEPGYAPTDAERLFAQDLVTWLTFHEAMLMDEVVPHLLTYLRANPGCPEISEFQHLLIDEYQDLNRAEQEVIELLGSNGALCIIGDDDQSIYSFKHAHPDGIRLRSADATTEGHQIADCRRCPTTVVRLANSLIARNNDRLGTAMAEIPANGPGVVTVRQYSTFDAEAQAVAAKIRNLIADGVAPSEIIVLAQRATFANPIYRTLLAAGIPVKSYYAETALDNDQAQERFAILKLYENQEDRVALRWLLGYGKSNWSASQYRRILEYVRANGGSPWQTLNSLADGNLNLPRTQPLVQRFVTIREEIGRLQALADFEGFLDAWLPQAPETELLAIEIKNIRGEVDSPSSLLKKLSEAITFPDVPDEVTDVRIMSLHKSKGLSSPYVFIVGCIEGLLPGSPNLKLSQVERDAKLEEDRRLFYVGITRVKARLPERTGYLSLTYSQTMPIADALRSKITPAYVRKGMAHLHPSRFLTEMGPSLPAAQINTPL